MLAQLRKSIVVRKSVALVRQIPRAVSYCLATPGEYRRRPPTVCNSFPKSGTHLLAQILQAFPCVANYGRFVASMPSITFREARKRTLLSKISSTVPGELIRAHLFYDPEFARLLERRNAVHFFIYRDPRDVVVSEAHYLTHMNRWHRLHRYFRKLTSEDARISFSILGATGARFPYNYPDVGRRFKRYEGWLDDGNVFAVRFEELVSEQRRAVIARMAAFYAERSALDWDADEILERAVSSINPQKAHTYRKGEAGDWRRVLTESHREAIKSVAGDLLIRLGYEQDFNW